ncbi:MAG: hypothetical protein LBT30_04580 [Clostridiales bacterium]|jgi:Na+/melibiose symporter-like transporter|nr:hypothetical protein [Clostridiales bacterium]
MKTLKVILFWFLSLTWGLPGTLFGAFVALIQILRGYKPKVYHGNIYFETQREHGSLNLGPFFFLSKGYNEYTMFHEAGHGIQNIIYGPLFLLIVGLTSITWYHIYRKKYKALLPSMTEAERHESYEKWWVEKQASDFGRKIYYLPYIEKNKNV